MSDYMFMLENHLTADQNRALAEVQRAAAEANVSLFLTGGAIRDMMGGFPIRDLDFTVEGNALKLAKTVAQKTGAAILSTDENKKSVEMLFPGGVTVEIAMARTERYAKPGGKAHVSPATIHEDLRGRDFTINAIALSLNKASRGLLLDPTNGLAELERRELRAVGNYTLYDNPARLLRLIRFKVRLGFQIAERTQLQYENARNAEVEQYITPAAIFEEVRQLAGDPNPGAVLEALEHGNLIGLISPALIGPKLNQQGWAKLQKARMLLPFGIEIPTDHLSLFLFLLTEKLTPKERSALMTAVAVPKDAASNLAKLEPRAKKLEKELQSAKLNKPSRVYQALLKVPGELLLFLLIRSTQRVVQDRIRNYLQKYLLTAHEVTDQEVAATGVAPGTPKFAKAKEQMITQRLDARPKKVAPEVIEPIVVAAKK